MYGLAKKILLAIGFIIILSFNFLGFEFLIYYLFDKEGPYGFFHYLTIPIICSITLFFIKLLEKLRYFPAYIVDIIVLSAIFLGLGELKFLLVLGCL